MFLRRVEHLSGNLLFALKRERHQTGTGAAEKTAERARLPCRRENVRETGNEHLPVGLVKMIDEHALQRGVIAGAERHRDARRALRVFDRVPERHFLGQKAARRFG